MTPYTILFYEYVEDISERRGPHREAHLAAIRGHDRIVMAGALGDPTHGAAIVFGEDVEPDAIERFVAEDPYVQAGLVTAWRTELWQVV
jgi:uncharacterized protein YciI